MVVDVIIYHPSEAPYATSRFTTHAVEPPRRPRPDDRKTKGWIGATGHVPRQPPGRRRSVSPRTAQRSPNRVRRAAARADPDRQAPALHTMLRLTHVATRTAVNLHADPRGDPDPRSGTTVTIEPRRGAAVAHLSIDDIEELYAVRAALEGLAAKTRAGDRRPGYQGHAQRVQRDDPGQRGPVTGAFLAHTVASTRCSTPPRGAPSWSTPRRPARERAAYRRSQRLPAAVPSRSRRRRIARSSRPSSATTRRSSNSSSATTSRGPASGRRSPSRSAAGPTTTRPGSGRESR